MFFFFIPELWNNTADKNVAQYVPNDSKASYDVRNIRGNIPEKEMCVENIAEL